MSLSTVTIVALTISLCVASTTNAQTDRPEHPNVGRLLHRPDALRRPQDLPLVDGKTSMVFRAQEGTAGFNLHSYLAHHDGQFWAVWSSGKMHEDDNGQVVRYATSADGHRWSPSKVLAEPPKTDKGLGACIARGIYVDRGRLTALVAQFDELVPGKAWHGLRLQKYEWKNGQWRDVGLLLDDAINNYPPAPLGDRLFMTRRDAQRRMYTALSATLDGKKWTSTPLPLSSPQQQMSEPSWYVDPDGIVHLIFRDQGGSHFLHRSISYDQGKTWTAPVKTDYPDATSKNFTGRLSSGLYFLINNPARRRDPLAISLSREGWMFSYSRLIRKNAPALRFPGRAKPSRSFQYPHAIEHDGSLWVIYSTNKEDIEITELPLSNLVAAVGDRP